MKKPSLPFVIILFVAGALVHKGLAKKDVLASNKTLLPTQIAVATKASVLQETQATQNFKTKQQFSIHKIVNSTVSYELHLKHRGHLETWKIIKGPSCNPLQKRKAIKKQPISLDYLLFEGAILKKHKYKEGILVWDHGTYVFETEPTEDKLSIIFEGTRIKGLYTLEKQHTIWTFKKEEDVFADAHKNITRTFTRSALSGKTLTHILHQAHTK